MTARVWQLPWKGNQVPHAVLDVLRGCNITCRACYNIDTACVKPFDMVRHEFELLAARRRLDSISLLGGEPTLHPQLCDIIRMIKAQGVSVELFTNGLLLDADVLHRLRDAGADMVFLHIDSNQSRPDLGERPTIENVRKLRAERAAAVAEVGMEVGLTMTAYADSLEEIDEAVQFVLNSPHVDYLLVTLFRDVPALGPIEGDLDVGMRATRAAAPTSSSHNNLTNEMIRQRLFEKYGLRPFAALGSNRSASDLRWISYLVATVFDRAEKPSSSGLEISAAEKLFLALHRFTNGRYPFYMRQDPRRFRLQLILNALTGGPWRRSLPLLAQSLKKHRHLRAKRLLFQSPAEIAGDGTIVHCSCCPDATVRHGRLVPVCIADQTDSDRRSEER